MLKISKKADMKPYPTANEFKSEKEDQNKIRNILASGKELNYEEIKQIYKWKPSINAQVLAHLMHVVTAKMNHQNYQSSMDFLLYLYAIPHQQAQLRHYLKNNYKIDPVLFLLTLLEKKNNSLTLKLASTIIDVYTLTLMLNGKQVVQIWRREINRQRHQFESLQEIQRILRQLDEKEEKTINKEQYFRSVIIPL